VDENQQYSSQTEVDHFKKEESGWKPTIDLTNIKSIVSDTQKLMKANDRSEKCELDHSFETEKILIKANDRSSQPEISCLWKE
jgi:hypothetical protein